MDDEIDVYQVVCRKKVLKTDNQTIDMNFPIETNSASLIFFYPVYENKREGPITRK